MKSFDAAVQAALSQDGSVQVTSQLVAPAPPWWKVMTPSAGYEPCTSDPAPFPPIPLDPG
jgi:hypothetical protein